MKRLWIPSSPVSFEYVIFGRPNRSPVLVSINRTVTSDPTVPSGARQQLVSVLTKSRVVCAGWPKAGDTADETARVTRIAGNTRGYTQAGMLSLIGRIWREAPQGNSWMGMLSVATQYARGDTQSLA